MGVPMGVPIFAQFGAAYVRPHGATGLDPFLGICWDQLDHRHDCELKFSRIFQKKMIKIILVILAHEGG